jgi:hypothetical protein
VTGPLNADLLDTPSLIDDSRPTITWTAAPGSWRFEVFLSNQTELTSTTHIVQNLTPILDENGDTIPDGEGDVLREEVRKFQVQDDLNLETSRCLSERSTSVAEYLNGAVPTTLRSRTKSK